MMPMPILFFDAWPYVLHLLILCCIYIILSMSINLITGLRKKGLLTEAQILEEKLIN